METQYDEAMSDVIAELADPEAPVGAAARSAIATDAADPETVVGAALTATVGVGIERAVAPVASRGHMPRIVSLIAGSVDEVPIISNGTVTADTVNTKIGGHAWKVTTSGAATPVFSLDPIPGGDPFVAGPMQAVCAWVYVPDATKITDIGLYLYHDAALTTGQRWLKGFSTNPMQTVVTGWNFIRIEANFSTAMRDLVNTVDWGTLYRVAISATCNAATDFTIGHMWAEVPQKAKLLLIADRPYKSYYDIGYPMMKALGVPTTFAIDCTLLGSLPGTINEAMTEAQVLEVAAENGNSISLHGWDGTATSAMTAAQLLADQMKGTRQLQKYGAEGRMWRASWVQQLATNAAAVHPYLLGCATSTGRTNPIAWPARDMYEIPRATVDRSISTADIDARFAWLQKTHQMEVCFIHRINNDAGDSFGCSVELWDYYVSKVEQGIEEGWLEGVTFEQLYYDVGGTFGTAGGSTIARYPQPDGTIVTRQVL